MPHASGSMLLYWVFSLDRLLLANIIGYRIVLSGVISAGQFMPFHTCKRMYPEPTPDISVLRYRCFFCL